MRRHPLAFVASCSFLCAFVLIGCGPPRDDDDEDVGKPKKKAKAAFVAETRSPIKATKYTVLRGKVDFDGTPDFTALTSEMKAIIEKSGDHAECMKGQAYETNQQSYRVGNNKGLGNVFVWIQPADRGQYFEIPKEQIETYAKQQVTLSQPHCAFLPHCTVLFPSYYGADGKQVPTGQQFVVENDAKVAHNANVQGGGKNAKGNSSLPPGNKIPLDLVPHQQTVSVSCNVHGWMSAYIRVFEHPYATLTSVGGTPEKKEWEDMGSPKVGTFEIKGVPVGAKVKLFYWHEKLEWLGKGQAGEEITIQDNHPELPPVTAKGK